MRKIVGLGWLATAALGTFACGAGVPAMGEDRASGQSSLMDDTFAGKNACNPDDHERPFIIEWDATDMSSFESYAASDVVVVRYEGCKLKVLDRCRNDSVKGALGSYRPVEWTSGSLETMEISNEGELVAKLPLGVATLGGRVQAGEAFHMEYYVAGTRTATRDDVYVADLKEVRGCEGATHFVYAYNLGAFALGSAKEMTISAEGSAYGFGAEGSNTQKSKADKKGGDLGVCKEDSATEVQGCKAPIRLSLRPISKEENPEATAMATPDTPESGSAAAIVDAKVEGSAKALAHYESAVTKMNSQDGAGCLSELDQHDALDPKRKSTDPNSATFAIIRSHCLMIAGKCDVGKQLLSKQRLAVGADPADAEKFVGATAAMHCQGKMSDRDRLLKSVQALTMSGGKKQEASFCMEHIQTILSLKDKVKPKDEFDTQVSNLKYIIPSMGVQCLVNAGACKDAEKIYVKTFTHEATPMDQRKAVFYNTPMYNKKCPEK